MINRRRFIKLSIASAGSILLLSKCKEIKKAKFTYKLKDDNSSLGHLLRTNSFPKTIKNCETNVLILGGGVAGLSAAYQLSKANVNFTLIELASVLGGNSIAGKNEVSEYPWAAHYLTIPNLANKPLLDFLYESGIIVGYDKNNLPIYKEEYVCHESNERLYINYKWQDNLIPTYGLSVDESNQINMFFKLINEFKNKQGSDGKYVFDIPLSESSIDNKYELDGMSMRTFLTGKGLTSKALLWYINYCCKDDFGAGIDSISAFAGIHYFASRRGVSENTEANAVLTWQEGNNFLIKQLVSKIKGQINLNQIAYNIKRNGSAYAVDVFDNSTQTSVSYTAKHIIYALPAPLLKILYKEKKCSQLEQLEKYPWFVANIKTTNFTKNDRGTPISWDNVIYDSPSLGYINNCNQIIRQEDSLLNITYYFAVNFGDSKSSRKKLREMSTEDLIEIAMNDLKKAHPLIEENIISIEIKKWGHGMITPSTNVISKIVPSIKDIYSEPNFHLVHTDFSGISIFEEAFDLGTKAANKIIGSI